MTTSNTNNETTMKYSTLPTTEYLCTPYTLRIPSKNVITHEQFSKVYMALSVSDFQHERLLMLCMEYNALTREQQVAQDEAHLSAEDDFAIFTDEHGHTIIQHEPTFTTFKLLGFEGVQMTTRTML